MNRSYRAVFVDPHANFGALGPQVEASEDDVVVLGSPGHAAAGQHAGRRKTTLWIAARVAADRAVLTSLA